MSGHGMDPDQRGDTLASGRATVLHGAVHLVLFAVFLFLSVVP